jgi:hypothetical protein
LQLSVIFSPTPGEAGNQFSPNHQRLRRKNKTARRLISV